ncbi:MAG: divalent metal cation transporter [Alphaproteobacteria bacterium]|nr:divalent metal cation transporter [Alphaproteobacteria bacterium]
MLLDPNTQLALDRPRKTAAPATPSPAVGPSKSRLLRVLGPGLITGASDDDPSGIGTYSQAGAQLGFGVSWTMLLTYPLMVAIQEISARVGRVTGRGIAGNIARHYPGWMLQGLVFSLFAANVINLGADLGAMGDVTKLLIGGPAAAYVVFFGVACVAAQIFVHYARYVRVLKWLSLSLFAYVAALAVIRVPWGEALWGLFVPHISFNGDYLTMLVAICGTTISPYLFFWQAAEEAEDVRVKPARIPLVRAWRQAPSAFARIRADTMAGMGFSNLIAVAIMITTAATLHANGVTNVETSAQAAQALKPIAGEFAYLIFAIGIIGTGLLGVPVLAGSAAYALAEGRGWPVGLAREPKEALAFYLSLVVAALLGIGLNFTPIDPIKALFWSAVINGVVAVPVMVILMLMTARPKIMGEFTISGWLRALGWLSTAAMAACVAGMFATWLV